MSDFRIRGLRLADASAMTDLLAAVEAVEQTGEHYSIDDVNEVAAPERATPPLRIWSSVWLCSARAGGHRRRRIAPVGWRAGTQRRSPTTSPNSC